MRIIEKAETVTVLVSNDYNLDKEEIISRAEPYSHDESTGWEVMDYRDDSILGYVHITYHRVRVPV